MKKIEQIKSVVGVVAESVKIGKLLASDDIRNTRTEICKSCDQNNSDRCEACGCNLLLKIRVAASSCPLKKW